MSYGYIDTEQRENNTRRMTEHTTYGVATKIPGAALQTVIYRNTSGFADAPGPLMVVSQRRVWGPHGIYVDEALMESAERKWETSCARWVPAEEGRMVI